MDGWRDGEIEIRQSLISATKEFDPMGLEKKKNEGVK
jgi:hypothetical protein